MFLRQSWEAYKDSQLRTNVLFCLIAGINILLLLLACGDISIHHREASGIFYSQDFAFVLARYSVELFGHNDYALRAPFIIIHVCNMILLFRISRLYLKKSRDSLVVILVYALLPGVIFSALFVLKSGMIIFVTLLCCFIQMRFQKMPYIVMLPIAFLDGSFAILFFALFFYSLKTKNTLGMIVSLLCFAINMQFVGIDISGVPRNYFLSTLGKMALFFSPLFLIYYFYTLYNALLKQKNILVDIGATSMFFVLLLSLRQDVELDTLFPMSVVALPVAIKQFYSDMRIRLPIFRIGYVRRFIIILTFLVIQSSVLYGNKILYLFGIKQHFASSYYISKEVANALKERGIQAIGTTNGRLELSLRFYGIKQARSPYLVSVPNLHEEYKNEIPIIYLGKKVASFAIVPYAQSKPIPNVQSRRATTPKQDSKKSQD